MTLATGLLFDSGIHNRNESQPADAIYDLGPDQLELAFAGTGGWERDPVTGLWVQSYDGNSDYASVNEPDLWKNCYQGTIAIWLNTEYSAATQRIVSSCDTATNGNYQFNLVAYDVNARLGVIQYANDTISVVTGLTNIADGKWHLGILVSTGSAWVIYLDGVAETLQTVQGSNNGDWFGDTPNRDNFVIGARICTTTEFYFNGKLNQARVWDYPFTTGQVLNMFNKERWYYGV